MRVISQDGEIFIWEILLSLFKEEDVIMTLHDMGDMCKQFRIENNYYQEDVARDTGYSVVNISAFENGRNNNARILLWYLEHGMVVSMKGSDNIG